MPKFSLAKFSLAKLFRTQTLRTKILPSLITILGLIALLAIAFGLLASSTGLLAQSREKTPVPKAEKTKAKPKNAKPDPASATSARTDPAKENQANARDPNSGATNDAGAVDPIKPETPTQASVVAPSGPSASSVAAAKLVALPSISPVVDKVKPAVVNIFAVKRVATSRRLQSRPQPPPMPPEDFFEDFQDENPGQPNEPSEEAPKPAPPKIARERVQGSGFVVDRQGYVITNNHVIEGAEEIRIKFDDSREIEAEIVGRDPKTDLALLRLKKSDDYPALAFGDSDKLEIGDWLLAIGNPFGLEHTVTKGILSARGRVIGAGPYDDFLQTDAAINPGNSGGPLINLKGEVVGVNALIYAGGEGIGFSIPSRLASKIVERIKAKGYVERGYIGAVVQPLTDDLAASFGLSSKEGALVGDALADAPASLAGIKPGDVIVEFDGHPVKGVDDLTALASESDVGKMVKVAFIRDQKKMTLDLTISRLDDAVPDNGGSLGSLDLGLILRELTPDSVGRENLPEENGLLVERIMENSPAQDAGVFVRDLILEVDRQSVRSLGEYYAALRSHPRGGPVLLWLKRGGRTIYRTVPLPGQKSSADQDD